MPIRNLRGGARALLPEKGTTTQEKARRSASWCTVAVFLFPFAVCLVLGCGGSGAVKVRGTVTLDGKPVDGAGVTFIPTGEGGRQASGTTGADGSFQLTTYKPNDGALPGEYKVIVQYSDPLTESDVPQAVEPGKSMKDIWDASMKAQRAKAKKPPKWVIPAKYSDPGKTQLKQKVPAEGSVTLDLKSK